MAKVPLLHASLIMTVVSVDMLYPVAAASAAADDDESQPVLKKPTTVLGFGKFFL